MGDEERDFIVEIEDDAWIAVRKRRDAQKGMDWAVVLRVRIGEAIHSICVYDNAHGCPERHWIRRGEKLAAEPLTTKGAARLDLPAAIEEIKTNWEGMVERWEP